MRGISNQREERERGRKPFGRLILEAMTVRSFSSESVEEKFSKPLLRLVVTCLDIMMPRKGGKSSTTEVGVPKYNFDEAISAIKSGVLYYKHEIDIGSIIDKADSAGASSSGGGASSQSLGGTLSPARRVGGSPSRVNMAKNAWKNEKIISGVGASSSSSSSSSKVKQEKLVVHRVHWEQLEQIMLAAIDCKHAEISAEVQAERYYFETEEAAMVAKQKLKCFQTAISDLPSVSGKWNKAPSELRQYQRIDDYVPTENIPSKERAEILSMLDTPLPTAYLGQPYNFDDGALTEEWMCTFADKRTGKTLPEEDIIKVLTSSTLDMICERVRDRVCSELGVLDAVPLSLRRREGGNGSETMADGMDVVSAEVSASGPNSSSYCVEQPVFGIDCACRRLIEVVLVDRLGADTCTSATLQFFIERKLLPAINGMPGKYAHSMLRAAESLCVALQDSEAKARDRGGTTQQGYVVSWPPLS